MFGEITTELLNTCIDELNKDENREKLRSYVMEPFVDVLLTRIERHIYTLYVMIVVVSVLLLWLILVLRHN